MTTPPRDVYGYVGHNYGRVEIHIAGERPVPFLAPSRPPVGLVGREELVGEVLEQLLAQSTVSVFGLNGKPGIGKTAIAIEVAHDPGVREAFPDGVLWAGLGTAPDPHALLTRWADALGIGAEVKSLGSEEQIAQRIADAIGSRRMLLVLDDAWDIATAALFRIGPNCAHLLTTRSPAIAHAFAPVAREVGDLSQEHGVELLARYAPAAVVLEPGAAEELVRGVGALPLAIRIMGHHLGALGNAQPRRIHATIESLRSRTALLRLPVPQWPSERHPSLGGQPGISLEAVIGVSVGVLDAEAQTALAAIAQLPSKPNSVAEDAAAAIAGVEVDVVDRLYDAGLLDIVGGGRYALHQSIAELMRESRPGSPPSERAIAWFREVVNDPSVQVLLAEQSNIDAVLHWDHDPPHAAAATELALRFCERLDAMGLYRSTLRAASRGLAVAGTEVTAVDLLMQLGRAQDNLGLYAEAQETLRRAVASARALDLPHKVARALSHLGVVTFHRGDHGQAQELWEAALAISHELGDAEHTARQFNNLAMVAGDRGDYDRAAGLLHQSIALLQNVPAQPGLKARTLQNLAVVNGNRGEFELPRQQLEQARTFVPHDAGRRCDIDGNLGWVLAELKRYDESAAVLESALASAREIESPELIAFILVNLGFTTSLQGRPAEAVAYLEEGLRRAADAGHPWLVAFAAHELGAVCLTLGRLEDAEHAFARAISIAREREFREHQGLALFGLARLARIRDDGDAATRLAEEALELLSGIRHHRAAEVREFLQAKS